jgi:transcription antitermination factor NusG
LSEKLVKFVEDNKSKPILAFMETYEEKVKNMLENATKKAHIEDYVHIKDEERMKVEIKHASKRRNGLISMLAKDGRGIDFKSLYEAKVLIIFNGKLMFRHSDIA